MSIVGYSNMKTIMFLSISSDYLMWCLIEIKKKKLTTKWAVGDTYIAITFIPSKLFIYCSYQNLLLIFCIIVKCSKYQKLDHRFLIGTIVHSCIFT